MVQKLHQEVLLIGLIEDGKRSLIFRLRGVLKIFHIISHHFTVGDQVTLKTNKKAGFQHRGRMRRNGNEERGMGMRNENEEWE